MDNQLSKPMQHKTETIRTTRPLSQAQIDLYHEQGFIIVRQLFDPEELAPLNPGFAMQKGLDKQLSTMADSNGNDINMASWTDFSKTLLGAIPRVARLVDAVEALIGEKCYHWHSKMVEKPPKSPGEITWHQDYTSWYNDALLFPQIMTCAIALNPQTRKNGCLKMVARSHLLGRLDTVWSGDWETPPPERMQAILDRLNIIHCEMEPGDAIFFHGNTVHSSDSNQSDSPRTLMFCTYNAASNSPFVDSQKHHAYKPLKKLPDSAISSVEYQSVVDCNTFHPAEGDGSQGLKIFKRPEKIESEVNGLTD